jgi:adenylate cyclase
LGYPDQAKERSREALALAQELSDPNSVIMALNYLTRVLQYCGESHAIQQQADLLIELSTKHGVPIRQATGTFMRGCALLELGGIGEGIALMQQGFEGWAAGAVGNQTYFLARLAEAYRKANQPEDGLQQIDKALALVKAGEERFCEAEIYQLQGDILLQQSASNAEQAENSIRRAMDIAQRQDAKALELRAAMSLARLWQSQGKRQDAYALLAPVYEWFTEGFDTADLVEAKGLLEALRE